MQILLALSPMVLMWLVALIVFALAEAATVGLVSIWFAGGALVALVAAALNAPVWLQVVLFVVISLILLISLRPLVQKLSKSRPTPTNVDRHIGQRALVTEDINNLAETGAIRLDGIIWTARSESGQVIPAGTVITVDRISGVKAFVSPAEVSTPV